MVEPVSLMPGMPPVWTMKWAKAAKVYMQEDTSECL